MGQSKKDSAVEAMSNTMLAFVITYGACRVIYPVFDIHNSYEKDFWLTCTFTIVSVLRNYLVRRLFNWREADK